ncbi:MAG TPA: AAA domain-containing protein [Allosphingosinicella sp.]|nr:AAA domain-containing protein [Allosphingosinicella sp.]
MAGSLAHIAPSGDNIIELDRVRPGSRGRASASRNLCPDLCPDFSESRTPREAKKSKKKELTPALIDDLRAGKLDDSKTGALSIEVLPSGKKRWFYRRRIAGRGVVVKLSLGLYPAYSIADAREWANGLNLQVDAGTDPRETARQELRIATMTVDRAHELYMEAVREGRSSRAKRINKPRTVADKQDIYRRDIAPKLGRKIIYDVYLIKIWPRAAGVDDTDLQQIWHNEMRQLHRLGGYPGAAETIAPLADAGLDAKGFYLVLDPGQRGPLQTILERSSGGSAAWLRNPRSPGARSRLWRNLKRIASGLEILHAQGLLHRNLDGWSVLTAATDEPDFMLTGFEWSMRVAQSRQTARKVGSEPDSFLHDWAQFGRLAAQLFHVDAKRLGDNAIAPFAVADHLSAAEARLLRDLHRIEFDDHIDGPEVGRRIDEIVGALVAEGANKEVKLHLVFRLAAGMPLVDRIRSFEPELEADDLIGLFDWVRADIGDRPLLMAIRPASDGDEPRLVLRGLKLAYSLRPFQSTRESIPSWEFAYCEAAERAPPAPVNVLVQHPISGETLELMTLREARERFPRLRGKARDWSEFRRQFQEEVPERTPERELLEAFLLTQFLETLFAAAEVFPVELVPVPATEPREESLVRLRVRKDKEREDLSDAIDLRPPARRLQDALTGDGLRKEGWRLTESRLLGEQEPTDTEWKFERVVNPQAGDPIYEFSGPSPAESGRELFLVPADSVGRDAQYKRRLKAMRALAEHSELLKMINDRRRRLLDSHEQVKKDENFALLDESKQQALVELVETLPIYLVQGPPGVGKTFLVRELALRRFKEDATARLLLSAQSNAALDHLLEEIAPAVTGYDEECLIVRCRARDSVSPPSPFDVDEQARTILGRFMTSPIVQTLDVALQEKLGALAGGRAWSRGRKYRTPATTPRAFESVVLRSANMVFATTNSFELEQMIEERAHFDWSIVEEAGKATGGELIPPQLLSHRRLMIGDHKQLPPFASDQLIRLLEQPERVGRALGIGEDLIGRTLRDEATDEVLDQLEEEVDDLPALCARAIGLIKLFEFMIEAELLRQARGRGGRPIAKRLLQQHRMHPDIADLVSHAFYDDLLKTHPSCKARFAERTRPFRSREDGAVASVPIVVVDMPALQSTIGKKRGEQRPRWHNPEEVDAVLSVLRSIEQAPGEAPTLAILSPYLQQVERLRTVLDAFDSNNSPLSGFKPATRDEKFVHTVDSFQGGEADLVIVSLVRNNDRSNLLGALGFLSDYRRMNVLLSRARWQMVLIGSLEFLREVLQATEGTDDAAQVAFLARVLSKIDDGATKGVVDIVPFANLRQRK